MREPGDLKKFRERQLRSGETIRGWGSGYIGKMMGQGSDTQSNGVLVVTDLRSVFYSKSWLSERVETIMHDKVSSVERSSMLGHHTLTVHTFGNSLEFKCMDGGQADTLYALIDELKGGAQPAAAAAPQPAASVGDQLEKLVNLRERGVLSDEEFAAQKAKLLA